MPDILEGGNSMIMNLSIQVETNAVFAWLFL